MEMEQKNKRLKVELAKVKNASKAQLEDSIHSLEEQNRYTHVSYLKSKPPPPHPHPVILQSIDSRTRASTNDCTGPSYARHST